MVVLLFNCLAQVGNPQSHVLLVCLGGGRAEFEEADGAPSRYFS